MAKEQTCDQVSSDRYKFQSFERRNDDMPASTIRSSCTVYCRHAITVFNCEALTKCKEPSSAGEERTTRTTCGLSSPAGSGKSAGLMRDNSK